MGPPAFTPVGAAFEQRRPGQGQDQQRRVSAGRRQVMDQIKRAVIAPVNIFQYTHRCPCGREICGRPAGLLPTDGAKKARKVLKCPVANLLRVLQSLGNVRLVRKVEAKDLTHEVPRPSAMPNCPGSGAVQQILQAFLKLFPSQGGRIALLDLETRAESVPYQRERKP